MLQMKKQLLPYGGHLWYKYMYTFFVLFQIASDTSALAINSSGEDLLLKIRALWRPSLIPGEGFVDCVVWGDV